LIATGSLRATWLPEGLNKSFVCTHILKISYEQLFLCHLIHFLCFLVCSQTHSAFFLFHLLCSVLESQSVESKNRRRRQMEISGILWCIHCARSFPWSDRSSGPLAVLGHKVRSKDAAPRNAPSSHAC
jgi:hypothetical protein